MKINKFNTKVFLHYTFVCLMVWCIPLFQTAKAQCTHLNTNLTCVNSNACDVTPDNQQILTNTTWTKTWGLIRNNATCNVVGHRVQVTSANRDGVDIMGAIGGTQGIPFNVNAGQTTNVTYNRSFSATGLVSLGFRFATSSGNLVGSAGFNPLTATVRVCTIEAVPTSPANGASYASGSSITLQWNPSVQGGCSITGYQVEITNSFGTTTVSPTPTTALQYNSPPATVGFSWRVRAKINSGNGNDWGSWSASRSVNISSTCTNPSNLSVGTTTLSSAPISWSSVSGAMNYTLEYRQLGFTTWNTINNITATSYSLSNLVSNTTYEWRVRTNCSSNSSSFVQGGNFTTQNCASPTGLNVSGITSTSATASWNSMPFSGQGYSVQHRVVGAPFWTPSGSTFNTSLNINGLSPATTYEFSVRNECNVSLGSAYSNPVQFSTTSSIPAVPTGLTTSLNAGNNTVNISWNSVPGATQYRIYKNGNLYAIPSETSFPDFAVAANTTQCYTVQACNPVDCSAQTSPSCVNIPATPTRILNLSGTLNFSEVAVGQSSSLLFTVFNNGNATLTVNSANLPAGFTITSPSFPFTVPAGSSTQFTVRFAPILAQSYSGNISFNTDATTISNNSMGVSGIGISRVLSFSGNTNFGNVQIGQTPSPFVGVNVFNNGTSFMTITSANLPAGYSISSPTLPFNVQAGNTVTINIVFTPTASTTYNGTISLNTNATSVTANAFTVSGVGTSAPVTTRIIGVSPNPMNFVNTQVGQSTPLNLTITNTGNTALSVTSISYSNTIFSGNWSGSIPAGGSQVVPVTFAPTVAQAYTAIGTVNSNATSGSGTFTINGTGTSVPVTTRIIGVSPNPMNFANTQAGQNTSMNLTITNTGNTALSVTSISYSNTVFSGNWSGSIPAGGSQVVPVTFAPTVVQAYTATGTVNSNATSGSGTFTISGTGTSVSTTLVCPTLNFPLTNKMVNRSDKLIWTAQSNLPAGTKWFLAISRDVPNGTPLRVFNSFITPTFENGTYTFRISNVVQNAGGQTGQLLNGTHYWKVQPAPANATTEPTQPACNAATFNIVPVIWNVPHLTQMYNRNWSSSCMPTSMAMVINYLFQQNFENIGNNIWKETSNSIISNSYKINGQRIYAKGTNNTGNSYDGTLENYLQNYPKAWYNNNTGTGSLVNTTLVRFGPTQRETYGTGNNNRITTHIRSGATSGVWAELAAYFDNEGISHETVAGNQTSILSAIERGPIIMSHRGHVICVVGKTANGNLIVNDSWGERRLPNAPAEGGNFVVYDWNYINLPTSVGRILIPIRENITNNNFSSYNLFADSHLEFKYDGTGNYNANYDGDGLGTGIHNYNFYRGFEYSGESTQDYAGWRYKYGTATTTYLYCHTTSNANPTHTATWRMQVLKDGYYQIQAFIGEISNNNSNDVRYRVYVDDATPNNVAVHTVRINQRAAGNWKNLRNERFYLTAGQTLRIVVDNQTANGNPNLNKRIVVGMVRALYGANQNTALVTQVIVRGSVQPVGSIISGTPIKYKRDGEWVDFGVTNEQGIAIGKFQDIFVVGQELEIAPEGYETVRIKIDSNTIRDYSLIIPFKRKTNFNQLQTIINPSVKTVNGGVVFKNSSVELEVSAKNALSFQLSNNDADWQNITLNNGKFVCNLDTGANLVRIKFIGSQDEKIVSKTLWYYLQKTADVISYFDEPVSIDFYKTLSLNIPQKLLGAKVFTDEGNFITELQSSSQNINIPDEISKITIMRLGFDVLHIEGMQKDSVLNIDMIERKPYQVYQMLNSQEKLLGGLGIIVFNEQQNSLTVQRIFKNYSNLGLKPTSENFVIHRMGTSAPNKEIDFLSIIDLPKVPHTDSTVIGVIENGLFRKILKTEYGNNINYSDKFQKLQIDNLNISSELTEVVLLQAQPPIPQNPAITVIDFGLPTQFYTSDSLVIPVSRFFAIPDSLKIGFECRLVSFEQNKIDVKILADMVIIKRKKGSNNIATFRLEAKHDGLKVVQDFTVDGITEVEELEVIFGIKVFPNPTTNRIFNVTFDANKVHDLNVRMISSVGTEVLPFQDITRNKTVDISRFANGLYFLEFKVNNQHVKRLKVQIIK